MSRGTEGPNRTLRQQDRFVADSFGFVQQWELKSTSARPPARSANKSSPTQWIHSVEVHQGSISQADGPKRQGYQLSPPFAESGNGIGIQGEIAAVQRVKSLLLRPFPDWQVNNPILNRS